MILSYWPFPQFRQHGAPSHPPRVLYPVPTVFYRCTILFIISIVAFVFQAYTGGANQAELDAGQHSIPMAGTLTFRIVLFVFTMIGLMFLAMIFATLRRISEGWKGSASREGRAQNEPSCPRY